MGNSSLALDYFGYDLEWIGHHCNPMDDAAAAPSSLSIQGENSQIGHLRGKSLRVDYDDDDDKGKPCSDYNDEKNYGCAHGRHQPEKSS